MKNFYNIITSICFIISALLFLTSTAQCQYSHPYNGYGYFQPYYSSTQYFDYGRYSPYSGYPKYGYNPSYNYHMMPPYGGYGGNHPGAYSYTGQGFTNYPNLDYNMLQPYGYNPYPPYWNQPYNYTWNQPYNYGYNYWGPPDWNNLDDQGNPYIPGKVLRSTISLGMIWSTPGGFN